MSYIRTTHTGSLPRPQDLERMIVERDTGGEAPGFEDSVAAAVGEAVRRQAETGIDLVNDGEQGKQGYSTYVQDRLTGFEGNRARSVTCPSFTTIRTMGPTWRYCCRACTCSAPACTGPVRLKDPDAVTHDIERLLKAAEAAGVERDRLFMSAASPGVIALFFADRHYGDREAYLAATC